MKPEERAEIMKTLKELTGKISQLKDELKTSSTASTPSKLKSKTEVFIVQHTCLLDYFTISNNMSLKCGNIRLKHLQAAF